jgi:hypothetical protein
MSFYVHLAPPLLLLLNTPSAFDRKEEAASNMGGDGSGLHVGKKKKKKRHKLTLAG